MKGHGVEWGGSEIRVIEEGGDLVDTAKPFRDGTPAVEENTRLRTPQREAYVVLTAAAADNGEEARELGVVLPVGCGKSGCIALAPFAFRAQRVLVVAPNLAIAHQLAADFDPARQDMFYRKCAVLPPRGPFPEPAEIRGTSANRGDLEDADVVITNIQQLQGENNRWLQDLPTDFFDLILFDEGHHAVAASWTALKEAFPGARIVNFSATPLRADGQVMAGRIVYTYPVIRAIQEGYVKHLKAVVLNPRTLRYVRREDDEEVEVSLEEVRRLGEEDAGFRRSIVTSSETLNTIVDASIRELLKLREATGDNRLKIIASALNFEHCGQIVEAYRARGLRADYVHSQEASAANERVLQRLANDELDVIVQVRKLGEGFDHPRLAVAAVFSVFANLSPFVQFVGRVMRAIVQNAPGHVLNQGVVVFHAGANVARRWSDFQEYSEADREYFDDLLPMEGLDFSSADELELDPSAGGGAPPDGIDIRAQTRVGLQEIPLIRDDPEAVAAITLLSERGYSADEVAEALEELEPVPETRQRRRRAMRSRLDTRSREAAAQVLHRRGVNPRGSELDRIGHQRINLVVLKAAIDRRVNAVAGHGEGQRHEFTRSELERVDEAFASIVAEAEREVFGAED